MEDDIKKIAGWGADHVRLPLDYENVETEEGGDIEEDTGISRTVFRGAVNTI